MLIFIYNTLLAGGRTAFIRVGRVFSAHSPESRQDLFVLRKLLEKTRHLHPPRVPPMSLSLPFAILESGAEVLVFQVKAGFSHERGQAKNCSRRN